MPGHLGMMLAESMPQAAAAAVSQTGIATSPANASAQIRWNTSGVCEKAPTSGTFSTDHTWKTDAVRPSSDYEIQLTVTSGSFSSAAAASGVYIDLSATRTWVRNRTNDAAGSDTVSGTYTIRHVASGLVVASGTFTVTATVLV